MPQPWPLTTNKINSGSLHTRHNNVLFSLTYTDRIGSSTRDYNNVMNLLNWIQVTCIGQVFPNHGYASFKFIPGTNDTLIAAISTQEEGATTATFITAFTVKGDIIYPQTQVIDQKFEGFEFIWTKLFIIIIFFFYTYALYAPNGIIPNKLYDQNIVLCILNILFYRAVYKIINLTLLRIVFC